MLCTASLESSIPKWLQGSDRGWVSAEYGMLPRSTHERMRRNKTQSSGRTQEISRLVARSLRSCVDLYAMKDQQITVDCDVIQADGGTRTAAITGGFVALAQAASYMKEKGLVQKFPIKNFVAAISVGLLKEEVLLDLCYQEDSAADTDSNFVINNQQGIVEIQGTAENGAFSKDQFSQMLDIAIAGCENLHKMQKEALSSLNIEQWMNPA